MKYRSDIDGLRALAVLPVILYHAHLGNMSGGFVGVDIFFVISGYLITRILIDEISEDRFSIVNFYERRARRILPALFTVLALTSIATYFLYFPKDFIAYAKNLLAVLGFGSNILLWMESGSYFDGAAHLKPLLHTWSLAVEEQFYIFFPILLIIVHRLYKKGLSAALWFITLLSLALSIYAVSHHPKAAFYLLPTRVWEMSIGSLAAAGFLVLPKSLITRQGAAIIGVAMILYAIFMYDKNTVFPGLSALLPCVGAVLIILAGQNNTQTYVGKILSLKPVVLTGLISYSLYLWHWPILAIMNYSFVGAISTQAYVIALIISFACAWISWRFIEAPFRGSSSPFNRAQIFTFSALGYVVIAIFAGLILYNDGMKSRFPKETLRLYSFSESDAPKYDAATCMEDNERSYIEKPCFYGAEDVKPTIAMWGDSHSELFAEQLGEVLSSNKQSMKHFVDYGCVPLAEVPVSKTAMDADCVKYSKEVLEVLKADSSLETIIIIARWAQYVSGKTDFGNSEVHTPIEDTPQERRKRFEHGVNVTFKPLLEQGKTIILMHSVPETGHLIPNLLAHLSLKDGIKPEDYTVPYTHFLRRQAYIDEVFDNIAYDNLYHIKPEAVICPNKEDCIVMKDGNVLYYDDDHLSQEGVALFIPEFQKLLRKVHFDKIK